MKSSLSWNWFLKISRLWLGNILKIFQKIETTQNKHNKFSKLFSLNESHVSLKLGWRRVPLISSNNNPRVLLNVDSAQIFTLSQMMCYKIFYGSPCSISLSLVFLSEYAHSIVNLDSTPLSYWTLSPSSSVSLPSTQEESTRTELAIV